MKLQFLVVDDDGNVLDTAKEGWLDGYAVGDRLLEGVMFRIRVNAAGDDVTVEIDPASTEYFGRLNKAHWYARIHDYALELDLFSSTSTSNDDMLVLYDFDKDYADQAAYFESKPILP